MIYFFAGDNTFELKKTTASMVNMFLVAHGDLALERLDAEEVDINNILESIKSMPFLATNKMVVIANVATKDLLEHLLEADVPDAIDVIVQIAKLDKRASYYKKLSKHPGYKIFETATPYNLPRWAIAAVEDAGGVISAADARYLIERVGTNQMLLQNEIDKLVAYNSNVTKDSINLLCEPLPQTSVFQLLDAAFAGKKAETEKIYQEQRAQKVEPQQIIGMIAWQLHILAIVKASGNTSADTIAKEAKLNPFVVKKSVGLARSLTLTQIKDLIRTALELDVLLKTKPVDPDQALQNYLLKISIS